MGHKNTDIDSLGACVGVCRAAMQADKPAYIVLGELNSSIRAWVSMLKEKDESYAKVFITHEQAIEMTNQNTVVVVVVVVIVVVVVVVVSVVVVVVVVSVITGNCAGVSTFTVV